MSRDSDSTSFKTLLQFFFLKLRAIIAIVFCITLIIFFVGDNGLLTRSKDSIARYLGYFYSSINIPNILNSLSEIKGNASLYLDAGNKNIDLTKKIIELQKKEHELDILRASHIKLKEIMRAPEVPGYDFVTIRIIADISNIFEYKLMASLPENHNVEIGYAIINEQGLVGKVDSVDNNIAKISLIFNTHSGIPATLLDSQLKCIARYGRFGHKDLEALYLPIGFKIQKPEKVVTSGQGGKFPYGILIGYAKQRAGSIIIRPAVSLHKLEFAKILIPR